MLSNGLQYPMLRPDQFTAFQPVLQTTEAPELVRCWEAIVSTLNQRGLLKVKNRLEALVIPQADGIQFKDFCLFVLDMHRLAGIPMETWIGDTDLHAQIGEVLGGRLVKVVTGGGLAIIISRTPIHVKKQGSLPGTCPLDMVLDTPLPPLTVWLGMSFDSTVSLDLAGVDRALLVGGISGAGKTNLLRSILVQLVHNHTPAQVQFAVVDLKRVDFQVFGSLAPYLFHPLAKTPGAGGALVQAVVEEMNRRFDLMETHGVTDWRDLPTMHRVPLLYVVIDELAEFVQTSTESDLCTLARMGRAAGISLALCTQHPTSEVVSSQIKANMTASIAFRTKTAGGSRVVLDYAGAEKIKAAALGRCLAFVGGDKTEAQVFYAPAKLVAETVAAALDQPIIEGPTLTALEQELVTYALSELGGSFSINKMAPAFKGRYSKHKLIELASAWELAGWLTPPGSNDKGHKVARQVTDALAALAQRGVGHVEN